MSLETWKLEKDLCRCCHAEGSFTSLAEPSQGLPQAETNSEILRRCFDINIRAMEGTYNTSTYTICEPCILQLRDASNFKQQVLRCEERFREMYRNVTALSDINTEEEEEEENTIQYVFKEEYFETSDDYDAGAADDGHEDAPLPKQPRLETIDDETDQVEPQKETKESEEIDSSVDLNKNTGTDIKARDVNGRGTTNKRDNLRKRNQLSKILQNVFICNDCGKRFGKKRTLAVHIGSFHFKLKNVHSDIPHTSNISEYRTDEIIYLKKHSQNDCSVSEYKCKSRNGIKKHLRIHTGDKPYSCSFCDYKSARKGDVKVHLQIHSGEKPYSCSFCEYKCAVKSGLTRHLRIHTQEKPYACSFCEFKCAANSYLKKHLRIHTGEEPYSCSACGYKFASKTYLATHLLSHAGKKPYSCSLCEYKCSQKTYLTSHLRTHTGEKPYSCSFCEYKCAENSRLKVHLRIHTGEKPYSCSFCEYKCGEKSCLNKHLRIHSGEKPYSCSFCEYKCAVKTYLKKHLQIHAGEKPYSCSFCEYKCTTKSYLKKHLRIHTGRKPYSCSFCEFKCSTKFYLYKHLRIIHTGEKP